MILPTKHIPAAESLLGAGAQILTHLDRPQTVTRLWDQVQGRPGLATFRRFVLALNLLYCLDAVELDEGVLRRRGQ